MPRRKRFWIPLVFAALALAALAVPVLAQQAGPGHLEGWAARKAAELEAALPQVRDRAMADSLEGKVAALRYQESLEATAAAVGAVPPEDPCALMPTPLPAAKADARPDGILEGPLAVMPGTRVEGHDQWTGQAGSIRLTAFAGLRLDLPGQGVVVVWEDNSAGGGEYLAPQATGALKIVAERQGRLELVDEQGSIRFFDLPARQFLTPAEAQAKSALPTVIPQPTFTPAPQLCPVR